MKPSLLIRGVRIYSFLIVFNYLEFSFPQQEKKNLRHRKIVLLFERQAGTNRGEVKQFKDHGFGGRIIVITMLSCAT